MAKNNKAKSAKNSSPRTQNPAPVSQKESVQKNSSVGPKIGRLFLGARIERVFMGVSLSILAITTVFWTVLSAHTHEANADQFIDAYLFEDATTFRSALFPGAHTFLIKWPLFALMQLYGHHTFVFLVATLLMVLITVGSLAFILYKIERRPWVFGLLCLSLASVLLLVPAQPHAGSLLPSNFAMTTTRNLEYIFFIACLWGMMRVTTIKSRMFWLVTGLLALVIASDKLFAVLAVGGACVVLVGYVFIMRRREELKPMARGLLMALVAFGIANILLVAINAFGVTGIVDEEMASPYVFVSSWGQFTQGLIYGFAALLTNFGANPVHDVLVIRELPSELLARMLQPMTLAYAFNLALFGFAVFAAWKVIVRRSADAASRLTILLVACTLTALAVFVVTDHYYPVDARYLTIGLFALFVALATYLRGHQLEKRHIVIVIGILVIVLPLGMLRTWQEFRSGQVAVKEQTQLTRTVAEVIDRKNIERIIGDYWEVTPVKSRTKDNVTIAPVDNCSQPRPVLNSLAWFDPPKAQATAFLAIRDKGASTYKGCSLARLATLYGTPTERVTLAKNPEPPYTPNALLLVYENGPQPLTKQPEEAASAPLPAAPVVSALKVRGDCAETSLNVVAHQDDDILFMNPDVLYDIRGGKCIRTVYITAGDAGVSEGYWQSRELGAKAAYAEMFNVPNVWHNARELLNGRFVTISYLEGAPRVSLIFLRLPDGNMRGEGFSATEHTSLQGLLDGKWTSLHSVDDNSEYTKDQLVEALYALMMIDGPVEIRTQGSEDRADGDHSDHHAVGILTQLARGRYQADHKFITYSGYPSRLQPENLNDDEITTKQLPFFAYAKHDGAVCQTAFECQQTVTYGSYLTRQYKTAY